MKKTILSIVLALSTPALFADDLKGKGEFSIYGGLNHINDNGGNQPIWGLNLGYGVAPKATIFGEFAHTPADGFKVLDYLGGVKWSLVSSEKAEPYALIGFGTSRISSGSFKDTDPSLHLGAGVRLYAKSKKWGVVPEIRWVRLFSDSSDTNMVRVTGGLFFQW